MDVSIARCSAADIDDVARFIDEHWEPGHALATCRPLLDWQHREAEGGYSFAIARSRSGGDLLGILGYIPTRRFDPALAADNVVWLTTWKVRDDANVAGLGLRLLQHVATTEPHIAIGALGHNPATTPIYKALGYRSDELAHYVRPNPRVEKFEVATLAPRPASPPDTGRSTLTSRLLCEDDQFARLEGLDAPAGRSRVPRKTVEYFRQRYTRHPIYDYSVVALFDRGTPAALLAARVAEFAGRRALRIVDFLGPEEVLSQSGTVVQTLLDDSDAEYADVYNAGLSQRAFECAGFRRVDPDGPEIVPDHFEPFERRNVRLRLAMKGAPKAVVFKGDADQDRPNRVPDAVR